MIVSYPVLWVIVRNDLSSMTSGKAEAHSGHAASAFHHKMCFLLEQDEINDDFLEWSDSTTQGFGTQINLSGGIDDIEAISQICKKENISYGVVTDPTYPFTPNPKINTRAFGFSSFTREEKTAMWIFGRSDDYKIKLLLGGLSLK
jgi:peptidyl-tRNA hydrolase